jgi:hypothetical protein
MRRIKKRQLILQNERRQKQQGERLDRIDGILQKLSGDAHHGMEHLHDMFGHHDLFHNKSKKEIEHLKLKQALATGSFESFGGLSSFDDLDEKPTLQSALVKNSVRRSKDPKRTLRFKQETRFSTTLDDTLFDPTRSEATWGGGLSLKGKTSSVSHRAGGLSLRESSKRATSRESERQSDRLRESARSSSRNSLRSSKESRRKTTKKSFKPSFLGSDFAPDETNPDFEDPGFYDALEAVAVPAAVNTQSSRKLGSMRKSVRSAATIDFDSMSPDAFLENKSEISEGGFLENPTPPSSGNRQPPRSLNLGNSMSQTSKMQLARKSIEDLEYEDAESLDLDGESVEDAKSLNLDAEVPKISGISGIRTPASAYSGLSTPTSGTRRGETSQSEKSRSRIIPPSAAKKSSKPSRASLSSFASAASLPDFPDSSGDSDSFADIPT